MVMTKIKFCGLARACDIEAVNVLKPDYIGFVFAGKSRRYVTPGTAGALKRLLDPCIQAVGVFVNAPVESVAWMLKVGIIDIAQLHGSEDETYIRQLRQLTNRPLIKAFRADSGKDIDMANDCSADYVLLDSGSGGTGTAFDWSLLKKINRPYFLAGGLDPGNAGQVVSGFHPYAVDVSSGIETAGRKDRRKMEEFMSAVRSNRRYK